MTDALAAAKARVRERADMLDACADANFGDAESYNDQTALQAATEQRRDAADLRLILDALDASAWRGIESAPKDGTEFLAAYARQGFVKQLVRFNRVWSHWESKGVVVPGFEANATHYMPLPPPPAKDDTNG
jgi:glycine/D-amino acid oxidase-like deaminating enzyme